jgi:hypothetical protein
MFLSVVFGVIVVGVIMIVIMIVIGLRVTNHDITIKSLAAGVDVFNAVDQPVKSL